MISSSSNNFALQSLVAANHTIMLKEWIELIEGEPNCPSMKTKEKVKCRITFFTFAQQC